MPQLVVFTASASNELMDRIENERTNVYTKIALRIFGKAVQESKILAHHDRREGSLGVPSAARV